MTIADNQRTYRPSNGSEGMDFQERFCNRCELDREFQETDVGPGCLIIARTMAYDVGDPEYPKEWTIVGTKLNSARCTAFEPIRKGR